MAAPAPAQQKQRMYAAAKPSRNGNPWAVNTSPDTEIRLSLRRLRALSQMLERDNDYGKKAVRNIRNNIVGKGIEFQAQIKKRRGGQLDDAINDRIEKLWKRWGDKKRCHTAGKVSFKAMQRALIGMVAIDGEVFIRFVQRRFADSRIPLALEIISADLLADEHNGRAQNGNEIRMGVELDEWLRPVAYYFYPRHPGDYQFTHIGGREKYKRVPADEILHLGVFENNQTRCVPWFHTAIKRLGDIGGYEEAEIVRARATASVVGFIQPAEAAAPVLQDEDEEDYTDDVMDFEPGTVRRLEPGETFTGFNPGSPNTAMDPFLRVMLRGVAAGIGQSFETLSGDFSQSNYSSSRLALLPERDNWRILQAWFVEDFLQPVYERWLELAVLSGALDLPAYETDADHYADVRWMPRGWSAIDPHKETVSDLLRIRGGLTSRRDVISENGGDYEDVLKQLAEERKFAQFLGLILDSDPAMTDGKGAQQVTSEEKPENTAEETA
ncbi:phage portal protein [Massilia sp. W12]|uniref:phage portal protein n=1 Tax=Massilia sp. W12 TaxID=3126507 RepID=UPI0030D52298